MLNPKTKLRELAYVIKIDEIKPIPNYDRVEYARTGGWWVIVRKDQFKVGDLAIYFEIDSKVPEKEPFMFLERKHFKIKTQKMCKVISQGLLMSAEDFGWELTNTGQFAGGINIIDTKVEGNDRYLAEGDFLTKRLGITYAITADNKRKNLMALTNTKKMASRHPKLFKNPVIRKIYKTKLGKRFLFLFLGRNIKKTTWPTWVVKTDEERCQNLPQLFPGDNTEWIATEKIDGTSTTFTMRGKGYKRQFLVCSRNVVFDKPDKNCYYNTNVYLEMAEKYNIKNVLEHLMDNIYILGDEWDHSEVINENIDFVTLQGETYGRNIQKRDYGLINHYFMAFNLIIGYKDGTIRRFNPIEMTKILSDFEIPCVPIVDEHFLIPETCDELLDIATGKSFLDNGLREGLVFRTKDGVNSFKAVSNKFLLKYHQ